MDTTAFLKHLKSLPTYDGQVAHSERIPFREASYAELDEPLEGELQDCLNRHELHPFMCIRRKRRTKPAGAIM